MKNMMSIDTEEWFHANYENVKLDNSDNYKTTVEKEVERLLELFAVYNAKATFFVLGFVAEKHPFLIKRIHRYGHEIASHGYAHQLVYKQSRAEFKEDLLHSKCLLEDIIGEKVIGYRAPSWSITEKSLWALDILKENGFLYHSGVFPTKNFMYGIPYAPRFIHEANVYGKGYSLKSVPPSTIKVGNRNIPFSGGAYFRFWPWSIIKKMTDQINEKENQPVLFYLHPREIDLEQPRLKLKAKEYVIHYYGINGCEKKLVNVLGRYQCESIRSALEL